MDAFAMSVASGFIPTGRGMTNASCSQASALGGSDYIAWVWANVPPMAQAPIPHANEQLCADNSMRRDYKRTGKSPTAVKACTSAAYGNITVTLMYSV